MVMAYEKGKFDTTIRNLLRFSHALMVKLEIIIIIICRQSKLPHLLHLITHCQLNAY